MIRCQTCDGILTKSEKACYRCGDPAPEQAKPAQKLIPLLLSAGLMVSLGLTAFWFLLGTTR